MGTGVVVVERSSQGEGRGWGPKSMLRTILFDS